MSLTLNSIYFFSGSDAIPHQTVKNEPQSIFSLYRENSRSFDESLHNALSHTTNIVSNDESNDDCVIVGDDVPGPLQTTSDDLTKRDGDTISNDVPYTNTVSLDLGLDALRYCSNYQKLIHFYNFFLVNFRKMDEFIKLVIVSLKFIVMSWLT